MDTPPKPTSGHGQRLVDSLVDDHADALFRYARQRVVDEATAEDLVQETFVAALRNADRFEERSAPRTWLIGILKHKIVDHWRRVGRSASSSDDDVLERIFDEQGMWRTPPRGWAMDPAQMASNDEFWKVFQACLEGLPAKARAAFALRVIDGDDGDQVCKALDITSTNLWVILHRARLRLRGCLEEHWFGDEPEIEARPCPGTAGGGAPAPGDRPKAGGGA